MASFVRQCLQSCLEPHVPSNKVSLPKSNILQSFPRPQTPNNNGELGGWSFIQALTETTYKCTEGTNETEKVEYVHPLIKRSSSTLSSKSLEMCTESLGSETGSDTSESVDEFCSVSLGKEKIRRPKCRELSMKCSGSFPPSLNSISGSNSFKVRPYREGGRLVIEAVTISSCNSTYFQAERTDGRLRLSLLEDCSN